jgi:hypothetical protein
LLDQHSTGSRLLAARPIHQADNSGMRLTPYDSEFAEVLIKSYENPIFPATVFKNFLIAGIFKPIASPDDIMAGRLKSIAYSP